MPTVVTPQIKMDVSNSLTNLAIICFAWGGKYKTGFQTFQELMYAGLVEDISADASPGKRRVRKPRTAASTPTTEQVVENSYVTIGRRGRGRPPKAANSVTKMPTQERAGTPNNNDLVLAAISAAGTSRQAVKANPTLSGIRPNHIGISISRLLRSARIVEREGVLYNITTSDQRAAAA